MPFKAKIAIAALIAACAVMPAGAQEKPFNVAKMGASEAQKAAGNLDPHQLGEPQLQGRRASR